MLQMRFGFLRHELEATHRTNGEEGCFFLSKDTIQTIQAVQEMLSPRKRTCRIQFQEVKSKCYILVSFRYF